MCFRIGLIFPHKSGNDGSRFSDEFFLCDIVHAFKKIILPFCNAYYILDSSEMLQVRVSMICIFNWNFKSEWTFLPPCTNVAIITDDAGDMTMSFWYLIDAIINLIKNILWVPPPHLRFLQPLFFRQFALFNRKCLFTQEIF